MSCHLSDAGRAREERGLGAGVLLGERDLLRALEVDGLPLRQPDPQLVRDARLADEVAGLLGRVLVRPQLLLRPARLEWNMERNGIERNLRQYNVQCNIMESNAMSCNVM